MEVIAAARSHMSDGLHNDAVLSLTLYSTSNIGVARAASNLGFDAEAISPLSNHRLPLLASAT